MPIEYLISVTIIKVFVFWIPKGTQLIVGGKKHIMTMDRAGVVDMSDPTGWRLSEMIPTTLHPVFGHIFINDHYHAVGIIPPTGRMSLRREYLDTVIRPYIRLYVNDSPYYPGGIISIMDLDPSWGIVVSPILTILANTPMWPF